MTKPNLKLIIVGNRRPNIVALPADETACIEHQLTAAWAEEDQIQKMLRAARAAARQLERVVSRQRGYLIPQRREVLQRPERS